MNELLTNQQLIRDILEKAAQINRASNQIAGRLCQITAKNTDIPVPGEAGSSAASLHALPPDLVFAIASHLDSVKDICRLTQVCKTLNKAFVYEQEPWQRLCMLHFGQLPDDMGNTAADDGSYSQLGVCAPEPERNPARSLYMIMYQAWADVQRSLQWLQEHNSPAGVSGRAHRHQLLTALEHMEFFTSLDLACSSQSGTSNARQTLSSCDQTKAARRQDPAGSYTDATIGQARVMKHMLELGAVPSLAALLKWRDQLHVHELATQVLGNLLRLSPKACQEALAGGYTSALKPLLCSPSTAVVHQACRALAVLWKFKHTQQQQYEQPCREVLISQDDNVTDQQVGRLQDTPAWAHRGKLSGYDVLKEHSKSMDTSGIDSCRGIDSGAGSGQWVLTECCSTGDVGRKWQLSCAATDMGLPAMLDAKASWTAECTPMQVAQPHAADDSYNVEGLAEDAFYQFVADADNADDKWQCWLVARAAESSNNASRHCNHGRPAQASLGPTKPWYRSELKNEASNGSAGHSQRYDNFSAVELGLRHPVCCYQGWWDKQSKSICGVYGSAEAFQRARSCGLDLAHSSKSGTGLRVFWIARDNSD